MKIVVTATSPTIFDADIRKQMAMRVFVPRCLANHLFIPLGILVVGLGILRRFLFGMDSPLWLDETFTGAIAIQPTFRGLIEDCLADVPGPIYYFLMWVWEKLFGASNLSLRTPSLLFSIAAPILILFKGHPDKYTRLLWAGLVALWIPGFAYASEARPYSLLFLLGTIQVVLFMGLLSTPTRRNAILWCGISSLLVLTHYHSALLTAFQGLAYLAVRRKEALRAWPAALLFVPAFVWMIFHLPLVLRFSTPEVAWQKLLTPASLVDLPSQFIGAARYSLPLFAVIVAVTLWEVWRRWRDRSGWPVGPSEALAVGASLCAVAVVIALGFVRPNFTFRYLLPFMPGVLLGVAILTRVAAERVPLVPWLVLGGTILLAAGEARIKSGGEDWKAGFSWERVAEDLAAGGAKRLIFSWDNPTAAILAPSLLSRVGSFFFDRAGRTIPARSVELSSQARGDPNRRLLAAAHRPGDAVLWVFDLNVPRTAAFRYPPALGTLDPGLKCRRYSAAIFACLRADAR
ncbi:MAG TPA: hypothetical protein VEZ48_09000 [Sphingomonadaceae bacterium]|nr:hypothetical protein [Sphingomonadaceae bacterium]